MIELFQDGDREALIAPVELFRDGWEPLEDGKPVSWNHAVRTSLALEIGHQLADSIPGLVLKGGTALQCRLLWPPRRASVDIDLEWPDASEVMDALAAIVDAFTSTQVTVDEPIDVPFSSVTYIRFPHDEGETRLRVDVSPPGSSTKLSEPWEDPPKPWRKAGKLYVPTLEAQAAQKLLLAADPPFGRDLDDHRGRQNFCKDIFDLHCLGSRNLDPGAIRRAATIETETKNDYLDGAWTRDRVAADAQETYRSFAHPRQGCPAEVESLWRAYLRMRPVIRAPFADGDLRKAAGCAHHAAATVFDDGFAWTDSWQPATTGELREAWKGVDRIEPVTEVADGFGEARGLLEAWARPRSIRGSGPSR